MTRQLTLHRRYSIITTQSLRLLGDAVAALDPELYADAIRSIIVATMDLLESGAAGLTWQRVELSLALLYSFGECSDGEMRRSHACYRLTIAFRFDRSSYRSIWSGGIRASP